MHSRTLESLVTIGTARTLLLSPIPRRDALLVERFREEAARLVSLPETMGHVFRAAERKGGEVHIEAVTCGWCPRISISN